MVSGPGRSPPSQETQLLSSPGRVAFSSFHGEKFQFLPFCNPFDLIYTLSF